ncbi:MAG: hypothetical protein V3V28_00230 [Polaribacter sp.]|uniref:hypothetical protein n=1 Tax=Polaribacter sp. TaxID=1920175 RepID=UPI002F357DCA
MAHPIKGQKEVLLKELLTLNNCEVIPADNKDVIVVVTETINDNEDDNLKEKIETFSSLKLLALVSGFNTPKKD